MGGEEMGKIKIFVIAIVALTVCLLYAGTPQYENSYSAGTLMSAGAWDTITVSNVLLNGDSIGVILDFNKDSINGWIQYQWVTPLGNSNTGISGSSTFTLSDGSTSFTNTGEAQAVFTQSLSRVAGLYNANLYVILKNNNSTAQTVTTNVYVIKWR